MELSVLIARIKAYTGRFFDVDVMKQEVSPYRDWAVVLSVFFVFVVVGAVCAGIIFISVNTEEVPVVSSGAAAETYSTEELAAALRVFGEKENELDRLMSARPTIADPSL